MCAHRPVTSLVVCLCTSCAPSYATPTRTRSLVRRSDDANLRALTSPETHLAAGMLGISSPGGTSDPNLLEERYKQLERNFKAIVAELQGRPSSARQKAELEALLSKLDGDLRHAMRRAEASSMAATQRLEERTAILQRNFSRVVELMTEPMSSSPSPSPSTPTGGVAARPPANGGVNGSSNNGTGGSPFSEHPWSGGAYASPAAPLHPLVAGVVVGAKPVSWL